MQREQQLETIEISLDYAKSQVALGEAVERLMRNRDFKKVILDEYFEKNAIRLVMLKGNPNADEPSVQAGILKQMDGIGGLREFLAQLRRAADMAEKSIADLEEDRATLNQEA